VGSGNAVATKKIRIDTRRPEKFMKKLLPVVVLFGISGCSDFALPPKMIVADGQTYYACKGYVRSFQKTWGGETYTVEFQERDGRKVQLRGISKLAITDMPAYVWSEIPANLPDPKTAKEGSWVGDWSSPKRAILVDGVWQPISSRNPACAREKSDNGSAPTHNSVTAADPTSAVVSLAEWEAMTPAQQAAYKGVIDLPDPPK
jgi:hypothetical protein